MISNKAVGKRVMRKQGNMLFLCLILTSLDVCLSESYRGALFPSQYVHYRVDGHRRYDIFLEGKVSMITMELCHTEESKDECTILLSLNSPFEYYLYDVDTFNNCTLCITNTGKVYGKYYVELSIDPSFVSRHPLIFAVFIPVLCAIAFGVILLSVMADEEEKKKA